MRVSEQTKKNQIMGHIQKNGQRLQQLQQQMSTGKKLNKISEDPVKLTLAQDAITSIAHKQQILDNIDRNYAWLHRNEIELQHIIEILNKVQDLVISQAGSSSSAEGRKASAQELRALEEELFDTANAKDEKLFLFSGKKSFTLPLEKNNPLQPAQILVTPPAPETIQIDENTSIDTAQIAEQNKVDISELQNADAFQAFFDGHSSNAYQIEITKSGTFGQAMYRVSDDGGETWSKEGILRRQIDVHNPDGKLDDQVILRFVTELGIVNDLNNLPINNKDLDTLLADSEALQQNLIFPKGMEFIFTPNPPYHYAGSEETRDVMIGDFNSLKIHHTAQELFFKTDEESVNTFEVLQSLEQALQKNDTEAISGRLNDVDASIEQVLQRLVITGEAISEIQKARQYLEEQIFAKQEELSHLQDLDMAEAAVNLNTAELRNKVSLNAGSRLVQPTLMDFLR